MAAYWHFWIFTARLSAWLFKPVKSGRHGSYYPRVEAVWRSTVTFSLWALLYILVTGAAAVIVAVPIALYFRIGS